MNLAADLAARARRHGWDARPAFYTGDQAWTHGEVHDLAARAATALAGRGVGAGDRVLIALPDGIEWVLAFLAAARLGATAVLANPALTADEHDFMAEDAKATLCVTSPELDGLNDRFDGLDRLAGDELLTMARAAAPSERSQRVAPHSPLYIQYTSGTTGRPKGVVHRHSDPGTYHILIGARVLGIGADDVALSVSKLFFAYGFGNAFAFPMFSGSAAVLAHARPTPALVAELIARHQVTVMYSVPSAYAALVDEADGEFGSLRAAVTAGERMPAGLGERLSALLDAPVYEQIGSTEAGHAFCANGIAHNMPGTVGRVVPGYQVELRDPDGGGPVPDGAKGELWVRGPTVTNTYLNLPAAAGAADGWLPTRDLACLNPDGTYVHLGRSDDMEMVGGITVSPLEIEDVLRGHPAVREVAVAAIPDERGATKLRAFVVPASAVPEGGVSAGVVPTRPGPASPDLSRPGPARTEPARTGSARTDLSRTDPARPDLALTDSADFALAGLDPTGPGLATMSPVGAAPARSLASTAPEGPGAEAIEAELISLARQELAPFKVPRSVRLVRSLPRTPTGKLRRHLVRKGTW